MECLQECFRNEKDILMDGGELERLMNQAGFEDVRTEKIRLEIGDWGPGLSLEDLFNCRRKQTRTLEPVWQNMDISVGSTRRADGSIFSGRGAIGQIC